MTENKKKTSFIKSNGDMLMKIYIHQIGLTVLGLMLYLSAKTSENNALLLGLGIFSTVFYLFLLYVMAWDIGAKDKIKIDGGRMERDALKGSKVCFFGMVPNLILAVLALIGFIFQKTGQWAVGLYAVAQLIGTFINAMYWGIGDVTGLIATPAYLFVICIPSIVACGIGYYFGTYEKFGVLTSMGKK